MQPGPFSSIVAVASLLVASFFGGAYLGPAVPVAVNLTEVAAPAARPLRRRRRTPIAAPVPPAPPPRSRRQRKRGRRVPRPKAAQEAGVLAAVGCLTLSLTAAALVGGAAARWIASPSEPARTGGLRDLAPSLGDDGRLSPPSSPPRRRVVVPPSGTVGDRDLLASLARREVRQ